jgi:arginyl-tRNA synthetase
MNLTSALQSAAKKAGFDDPHSTGSGPGGFSLALKIAEPKFGDLQLNGALAYAKAHGLNPREVAQKFVDALDGEIDPDQIKLSIAGAGFINFTFTPKALVEALKEFDKAEKLSPGTRAGEKIVVDYGGPNLGKQLHIGHMRMFTIGEALQRILGFCGARIHRDCHWGDWGTTLSFIIYIVKKKKIKLDENDPDLLTTIDNLYKESRALAAENPAIMEEIRQDLVKLQNGDKENRAIWKTIVDVNVKAIAEIQKTFGVEFDTYYGESFYNDKLERVYKELQEIGLAKVDDDALVVFHPEHPRFKEQPFLVRKSDGASNYGSTDLATMLFRVEVEKADAIYIVTDARQIDHFEQLWLTTQKWFAAKGYKLPKFTHIYWGTIQGEDGKPFKTRSGESVKLRDVLNEAVERARKIVDEKNPELPESERKEIAEVVGIGALRYADLAQNRTSDYQFNWDKLLSFEGNTAPYLLYAVARIYSLFEKLNRKTTEDFSSVSTFETPAEIALARKIIQAPTMIALAASDLRPHYLATYLYELTGVFSSFYNSDHIQGEAKEIQNRRLLLAQKTLLILETGLHLLGLKTVKRM